MLYIIHEQPGENPPDLCGEAAKDLIAVRFDLQSAIDCLPYVAPNRQRYGLSTGTLYVSEGGRRVVYTYRGGNEEKLVRTAPYRNTSNR
jgi:hypothetical protein